MQPFAILVSLFNNKTGNYQDFCSFRCYAGRAAVKPRKNKGIFNERHVDVGSLDKTRDNIGMIPESS